MRSALSATRLASAARSSPEVMLKPMVENWLGMAPWIIAENTNAWFSSAGDIVEPARIR